MRIRLEISYLGSEFLGWQSQRGGGAVQDVLEEALGKICGEAVRCHGAGRTDAGAHALRQTAHFDVPPGAPSNPAVWAPALNARLPPGVRVLRAARVADSFHARFSATGKHYRYLISTAPALTPFLFRRVWHHPAPLDTRRLRLALGLFVGRHDFRSFTPRRPDPREPAERTIAKAALALRPAGILQLDFVGEGFLFRMVRMLVAAAARVARGKTDLENLRELLEHPRIGAARHVAPADGLYLVRALY